MRRCALMVAGFRGRVVRSHGPGTTLPKRYGAGDGADWLGDGISVGAGCTSISAI